MVVAKIPLWVIHSSNESTGNPASSSATPDSSHNLDRAQDSLSLLRGRGKCAIYSVDMHPSGDKFATGGGDGTVKLWCTSQLFSHTTKGAASFSEKGEYASSASESEEVPHQEQPASDHDSSSNSEQDDDDVVHDLTNLVRRKKDGSSPQKAAPKPPPPTHTRVRHSKTRRLLSTMSAHSGSSVLAVRFSKSGHYLASAGDDAAVCIYARSTNSGNMLTSDVEHWSRIKLCRGHMLDVVGLSWAPDNSHLVSCSLDSNHPIIVWKLTDLAQGQRPTHDNVLCHPYKILGQGIHTSTVKGVTFDPAGTYLASSGDDPAVCIWRAHDDWGLEQRLDASCGIFKQWKEDESLSSQTLFRRLSWSTDGTYICSTNSVVKNKHVASTISRQGWTVSNARMAGAGAANLVGHKQPVVVSRHCPYLLDNSDKKEDNGDEEPESATLLALGDKSGFVTVWTTRRSRPIFKLQCSETRCTITDLTWGRWQQQDLLLLVSLLDGQMVALRFGVPKEVGPVLSDKDQARVFQLKYGIDLDIGNNALGGSRRLFVGENSGPRFIENALQISLEEKTQDDDDDNNNNASYSSGDEVPISQLRQQSKVKAAQIESQSGGKKRIRPVLMSVEQNHRKKKPPTNGQSAHKPSNVDPLTQAMELVERAATESETVATQKKAADAKQNEPTAGGGEEYNLIAGHDHVGQVPQRQLPSVVAPQIPHTTDRIQSVELPLSNSVAASREDSDKFTAECANKRVATTGQLSNPCALLSISRSGKVLWRDQLVGTSCSAIAASQSFLALGTSDGCIQLYGTSPSLGWASGLAFRSYPTLVVGQAVVSLQLQTRENGASESMEAVDMLVLTADGTFGVYSLCPELVLLYKGSIMPAMTHMSLSSHSSDGARLPKMSRIQITELGHLILLLGTHAGTSSNVNIRTSQSTTPASTVGVGGSLQAFIYNRSLQLWMRIADSRFLLSDFYSSLPSGKASPNGVLKSLDDSVRVGATTSSLGSSRRSHARISEGHASTIVNESEEPSGSYLATRSHCEDRMACALALRSSAEFRHWLSLYVRKLASGGHASLLRLLVDMLLGADKGLTDNAPNFCWWLSQAPAVLELNRKDMVRSIVIPEMSKNRSLQRITNEIALEIDAL